MREGVAPDGKRLYPAMPYAAFSKITDDDMRALYAYMMQGVAPVAKAPPPTRVPFPFNQRWALAVGRLSHRTARSRRAPPAIRVESRRVSRAVARTLRRVPHAARRGISGARLRRIVEELSGGWNQRSLVCTQSALRPGCGTRTDPQGRIAAFLKTGHGGGMVAFGSMVQTVEDSLQYLTDDDLLAIAHYLKGLPATGAADGQY